MLKVQEKNENLCNYSKASSEFVLSQRSCEQQEQINQNDKIKGRKKLSSRFKKQKKGKKTKQGAWGCEEQERFLEHMKMYQSIYANREERRKQKIFKDMSKFIKTRSSDQCRSHHQKYQMKCGNYQNIIAYIQKKLKIPPDDDESSLGVRFSPIRLQECQIPPNFFDKNPYQAQQQGKRQAKKYNEEGSAKILMNQFYGQKQNIRYIPTNISQEKTIKAKGGQWEIRIKPNNEFLVIINYQNFFLLAQRIQN